MLYTDNFKCAVRISNILVLLSIVLVMMGCASSPVIPLTLNSIQYVDHKIERFVQVSGTTLSVSDSGNKRLNMLIRNHSNGPLAIELNTAWYNSNFISTENSKSWKRVILNKNETHVFQTYATNSQSSHFIVNVRSGGI